MEQKHDGTKKNDGIKTKWNKKNYGIKKMME